MGFFGPPNIEKLKKAGKTDRLIKALNEKETDIRLAAIKALREIRAFDALEGLSQLILSDSENALREAALKAFLTIVSDHDFDPVPETVIELISSIIKNENSNVIRVIAVEALMEIKDQRLINLLIHQCFSDTENDISRKSQETVAAIGPDAVVPLIKSLPGANDTVTMQHRVSSCVLGELRDGRAFESLVEMLSSSDAAMRKISVEALGRIGDTMAIPHLMKLLTDSDQDVGNEAAMALAKLGNGSGRDHLVQFQNDDKKFDFQRDQAGQAIQFLDFIERNDLRIHDAPEWQFSIACPKTWSVVYKNAKAGSWKVALQANGPKKDGMRTGLMVNVRSGEMLTPEGLEIFQWGTDGDPTRHPKTVKDYLKQSLDHLNKTFKEVTVVSARPISYQSWPGTHIVHSHQASRGRVVEEEFTIMAQENTYQVLIEMPEDLYEQIQFLCMLIFKSFRVKPVYGGSSEIFL